MIKTMFLDKNAYFFAENWQKIAENCDHYIDPRNDFVKATKMFQQ
jgi:hypothetical protein